MVTFAVEALVEAGFTELMLVTEGTHAGEFFRLLGNGDAYGIERLFYAYQDRPGGIAEELGLAERFVGGDRCCVLLGHRPPASARACRGAVRGAGAGAPGSFFRRRPDSRIVEKPTEPASRCAVTSNAALTSVAGSRK